MTPDGQVKRTIQLPKTMWAHLERRSSRSGSSKAELLRRAIRLYLYVLENTDADDVAHLVIRCQDGTEQPLVLLP